HHSERREHERKLQRRDEAEDFLQRSAQYSHSCRPSHAPTRAHEATGAVKNSKNPARDLREAPEIPPLILTPACGPRVQNMSNERRHASKGRSGRRRARSP